ncbi:hypothetical protein KsCSTR_39890 [Candidatus Kuenenia stuttgartiensis]|uniref:Uncharacterized protein n=1 Tax=Kuenenia stuttgartiensis TaxID=174633 RepID=Q1PUF1_KUEST|nr:hypothetical protein KsCSTR_39890 [Candidatus Kuenenia stuttgartiensis]CAJ70859.1 unknown protein [Candidatus Kuenenia stuttgartiensis]
MLRHWRSGTSPYIIEKVAEGLIYYRVCWGDPTNPHDPTDSRYLKPVVQTTLSLHSWHLMR